MANRMREDVESAYLDITEFTGQSLTGPRDLISRKVLCSNTQILMSEADAAGTDAAVRTGKSNKLQQLNFRLLSTSPGACLNAKVELVCPMIFHHMVGHDSTELARWQTYYNANATDRGHRGFSRVRLAGQVAPRRNGLLKACSSITSTVNSTVSFTFRPDEGLDVMEQIFTQPGVAGQTGVYSEEESSCWGNNDGNCGAAPDDLVVGGASAARAGLAQVRGWYGGAEGNFAVLPNRGFIERRADFRSGGGAVNGGIKTDAATQSAARTGTTNYVKYDYRTTLCIPPFKTFAKDIYCRTPTFIPYCDSVDLQLSFKPANFVKAALLQCASLNEAKNLDMVQDYDIGLYAQPYLKVEWVVPPVSLRPSYTLPCWRNQSYTQKVEFLAADTPKHVTFQGIRMDSMPSLISIHVQDGPDYKQIAGSEVNTVQVQGAAWNLGKYHWTEYFGKIDDLSLTVNEKISILSDKDAYDMYRAYRMYAPDSKMSFTVWRNLRQVCLIRSDILAVEKGQAVYSPTNLSVSLNVTKAIQHLGSACTQEVRMTFWYFNDALTLSQQSAAVTSMLLSPSDVQQLRVSPEAKEIQTLMEMGLQ